MFERSAETSDHSPAVGLRVLVLDPDASSRGALQAALVARGMRAAGCASAGAALAILRADAIDAVAVHLGELESDGIETCRHVSTNWPELPIVVLAEGGPLGTAIEAFQAGAYDLIVGRTDRASVVDAIEHAAHMGVFRREMAGDRTPAPVPGEGADTREAEGEMVSEHVERRQLMGLLLAVRGSVSRAAEILHLDRSMLVHRLVRLGVVVDPRREDESRVVPLPPPAPIRRAS